MRTAPIPFLHPFITPISNRLSELDMDSPSLDPPSSSSISLLPVDSDLDAKEILGFHASATTFLKSSIATISQDQLRSIVSKLADNNFYFQRALIKELAYATRVDSSDVSSTTTPTFPRRRKSKRCRKTSKIQSVAMIAEGSWVNKGDVKAARIQRHERNLEMCTYHPGHLDEEVYEFLSISPGTANFKDVRTISMWSCCNEDEWSPGCVAARTITVSSSEGQNKDELEAILKPSVLKNCLPKV